MSEQTKYSAALRAGPSQSKKLSSVSARELVHADGLDVREVAVREAALERDEVAHPAQVTGKPLLGMTNRLPGAFGDHRQVGLPHVRADEVQRRAASGAEPVEEAVQRLGPRARPRRWPRCS